MGFIDFHALSLWINVAAFAAAALAVWIAGTRLAGYADGIARRTQLSKVFLGIVLLGMATSLPEVATTITAGSIGNTALLSGNIFGGVALQTAILAVVDVIAVRGALSQFAPQPILLLQGVMLLLLLAVALAGSAAGEPFSFFGIGVTSLLLAAGYVLTLWVSQADDLLPRWRVLDKPERPTQPEAPQDPPPSGPPAGRRVYGFAAVSALVILVAGWTLAETGDALAAQTGLGSSFVGVTLLAASTSLPELSTTLEAVRRGNFGMGVSNILGTNCLTVALFFVGDLAYRGGPILAEGDRSATFAATISMVVTCLYLLGLLERRDRTVLGMGIDSFAVLVVYATGLVGLYAMR